MIKKAEYEGQVGWFDDATNEFRPSTEWKKAEYSGQVGIYNTKNNEFIGFNEAQPPKPKTSFMDKAKKVVSDIGQGMTRMAKEEATGGRAIGETAAALGSGMVSWIPGGLSMALPTSPEEAQALLSQGETFTPTPAPDLMARSKRATGLQQALSFEPRSEEGKQLTETVMTPLTAVSNKFEEGAEFSRQKAKEAEDIGDMELAKRWYAAEAAANFGKEAWMFAIPVPIKGLSMLKGRVKSALNMGSADLLAPVKQPVVPLESPSIIKNAQQILAKDEQLRGAQKDRYVDNTDLSQKIDEAHMVGVRPETPRYEGEGNVFKQKDLYEKIEKGGEEVATQLKERFGEDKPLEINVADQMVTELGGKKEFMSPIDKMRFETIEKDHSKNRFDPRFEDSYPQTIYNADDLVFLDRLNRDLKGEAPWEPTQKETATGLYKPEEYAGPRENAPNLTTKVAGERTIADILNDLNTALGETGAIGKIKVPKEVSEARQRLQSDYKLLSEKAGQLGKDVNEYLKSIGLDENISNKFIRAAVGDYDRYKWGGDLNAVKKGEVPEGGVVQRQGAGQVGETAKTGSGDSAQKSGKVQEEVVNKPINDDIQILTERGADPEVLNGMTPEAVSNMRWMSDQMEAKRIIRDIELGTKVTPEERAIAAKVVGEKAIRKLEKENQKASKTEPVPETASTAVKTEVKPEGVTTIPPKEVKSKTVEDTGASGVKKGIPEDRAAYLDGLLEKAKKEGTAGRIKIEKLPTKEQRYLVSKGAVFDVDRMGKPTLGYSEKQRTADLREKVTGNKAPEVGQATGEQSGTVNLSQKGASKTKAKKPDSIRIEKTEKPKVKAETPKVEKSVTTHGTEDPNLRVAVKDENGKVYVGEKGEIHADLADRVGLLDKYTEGTKIESGFADKDGRFIRRSTTDESINPAELNLKDRDLTDPVVQNNTISEILEVYKEDVNGRKKAVGEFTQELKRQTEPKKTEPVKTEVKEPVKETVKESVKEPVKKSATKLSKPTADTIEQALNKKLNLINKQIDEIETQNRDAIKNRQDVPEARLNRLYKLKQDRDITEKALLGIERKPEKTTKKKITAEARTIEASLEDKKAAMELGIPTEEYMAGKKAKKGEVTLYSNPIAPVFQEIKNRFVKFTDNLEFRTLAKTSDETFAHFVKRILQDRRIAIKSWEAELKERGINIPDRLSVYMTFERMPSKVADTMLQFERDVKKPLIKSITNLWKESKLTFDNLTEYMQALDAAPRYKAIQNRLKKMKEEAASPEEIAELEKRGSGMSQEEANAILEKYRKTGADKKMDDVAKMIHNIAEARLDLLEKYGLETPEMIKQMREEFGPTYVPWRGKEGVKKYGRTGASYSGSTIKHALGRTSKATENPIAHILNDYQNTVIKIFENEPKRTMLELVREIKDPDITVNEVTLKQRLNKEGQVETYRDAVWSANDTLNPGLDNVIDVMDNGKHYYIKIKGDPLLVRAFQKLPVGSLEALTGGIGKWTRAMAQLKTMYSPEFILTNPFRDMFDAVHGLATEHKASYVADAMKDYKTSMKECYDYFRNGKANDLTEIKNMDGSVSKVNLTKEYFENVQVGFWSAKDVSIAHRDLGKQLQREVASGIKGGTARTWKAVSDYVSDMSSVTENAMRMSVYRTLRKNGHSMEQAAAYAKNVTLNFNRRGELGWISNLYMFANPGIQGIKRFKDLATTKRGMKILTGITTAAVTLNIMNRWLAGEDDSGTNNFAKMSAGERSRNLIVMGTDGRPLIKLPLGFQQRLPFGIANSIADVIMGDVHPVKASLDFADVFFDSFNPISGSSITKGTAASFAPSLAKPFFEIESNTDTFGRPIYPKAMIGEDKPESELFFRSVSPISKEIAQGLHRLSGKDKFHAGGIDVSPESIDHVVKNYFGGIGDTLYRAASLAFKTADDMTPMSSIGRHEIPIARRFTGANIDQFSQNRFREIIDELRPDKKSIDNANDILKNGDPLSSEYDNAVKTLQEYDDKTELIEKYAERVREVSDINKEIDKVKAEKDMPVWYRRETIEYLEGKKIDIYNQTIWQYNNRKMLKGTEPTEDMI